MIKKSLKNFASKIGWKSAYDKQQEVKREELIQKLETATKSPPKQASNSCSIVVFSKDRAMQLDALLRSYFYFGKNAVSLNVLYYASNENFEKAYQELNQLYANQDVKFKLENNFKEDLKDLLNGLKSTKILFLVDDIFFKNEFDLNEYLEIDPKKNVASLRLGEHLNFAYTLQKEQKLPSFFKNESYPAFLSWSWQKAEYDWAYPLSVDGNLFDTNEMRILINELEYRAPNSLESALQLMDPYFAKRNGLCYANSVIVNNPCNKVQIENKNVHGEVSIEELNQKWLQGYRIYFEMYKGIKNKSAHEDLALNFVKR